jgi:hypothetical protein
MDKYSISDRSRARAVRIEYPYFSSDPFGGLFAYNGIRSRTREQRTKDPWLCAREPDKIP